MDISPASTTPRAQRADARRNREKIVEAASAVFAEDGLDAQMDEIARRAGVGVGTLYRHFPTKDALVRGLVEAHMGRMAARGREIIAAAGDDPWQAFAAFVRSCGDHHAADRALAEVMSSQPASTFTQAAHDAGLVDAMQQLLQRAQAAGVARADARVDDVPIVMCALAGVLRSWGEDRGRRFMELALDGLRSGSAPPLPDCAPLAPDMAGEPA